MSQVLNSHSVIDFLRHLALFSGLADEELARLSQIGHEITVQPGAVLMREGEPGDAAYIVLEGEFEVTKEVEGSEVTIARRGPGEVIGEIALLDGEPRLATIRAQTAGRLLKIERDAFNELLASSPSTSRSILKTVASRLRNTESMLRQSEKMAALGTLSAGIAHELNNPAAAAQRAAKQLSAELANITRLEAEVNALAMDAAQQAVLEEWRTRLRQTPGAGGAVDPLERSDMESEVQEWLEERQVENAWQVAPSLVGLGIQRAELDSLAGQFQPRQLALLLQWMAAQGSVQGLLDAVGSSTERISTIVNAIKSYVYLDQAPVQEVDIHTGLENTLVILHFKLKQGVTVKRDYARDLPRIEAYASELNQVWTNIIDNAIDAMHGRGTITIRTYAEGNTRVLVEICDDGPGIPPDVLPHIFEPFFTTKPIGKGTGLGLHITYNIVTLRHHGEISVESGPGKTCFKVALPVRPPDGQAKAELPSNTA